MRLVLYKNKKELLKRCKRDEKDVRWFDKQLERGNVVAVERDEEIVWYFIRVELENDMIRLCEEVLKSYKKEAETGGKE